MGSTGKVQVENLERLTMCETSIQNPNSLPTPLASGGWRGGGEGEELIEMLLQDMWVAQGRYRWKIWIDLQCVSIQNPNTSLVAL